MTSSLVKIQGEQVLTNDFQDLSIKDLVFSPSFLLMGMDISSFFVIFFLIFEFNNCVVVANAPNFVFDCSNCVNVFGDVLVNYL